MSDVQKEIAVTVWTTLIIWCSIVFICQIYGVHALYSIRNLLIVQKRYPRLVFAEAISAMVLVIILPPYYNYYLQAITLESYVNYIGIFITFPLNHFIANIEACRLWLMSFKLHYLHSSKNKQWISQIDQNFVETNWYLQNQHKYGNPYYIIPRIMVYCVFAATISTLSMFYFQKNHLFIFELVDSMLLSVPLGLTLYCMYKCPKHSELNDNLLFHYEFTATAIIYTICFVDYFIGQLLHFLGLYTSHLIILIITHATGFTLPSLLSTIWITWKIRTNNTWILPFLRESGETSKSESIMVMVHNINHNKINKEKITITQRLLNTLCNEEKFQLFVQWMYREFSSESILCFIEFVQFKKYLVSVIGAHSENNTCKYIFYESVPKSSIIDKHLKKNNTSISAYKTIAHVLYLKYIDTCAELEVNISGELRAKYLLVDEGNWDIDKQEMMHLFDQVIDEMFILMLQSFARFEYGEGMDE
eukprot:311894_1